MSDHIQSFHKTSYDLHAETFADIDPNRDALKESWFVEDTVDYWRHKRMFDPLLPLLKAHPGSKWLTIGDGRFGLDAIKLRKMEKSLDILPTDISPYLLQRAKAMELIKNYKVENAEDLSFSDDEFDFSFCKESYHHFPRPALALYEMLRVAKTAVVLIEPNDPNVVMPSVMANFSPILKTIRRVIKNRIKLMFGKSIPYYFGKYETVGNYVYSISEREIEKIALGLDLPVIAFKGINDHYIQGVEFEKATEKSTMFGKVKSEIAKLDKKAEKGLVNYGLLIAIIFKNPIDETLMRELNELKFFIKPLPRNPYAKNGVTLRGN